jgi:hypothetical protein
MSTERAHHLACALVGRWAWVGGSGSLAVCAGRMGAVSTSPRRRRRGAGPGRAVLDAVLERITYANEETGYTIARVATDLRCGPGDQSPVKDFRYMTRERGMSRREVGQ